MSNASVCNGVYIVCKKKRAPGTSMGDSTTSTSQNMQPNYTIKFHTDRATPITMQQAHTTVTIAREKHIANQPSAEFLSAAAAQDKTNTISTRQSQLTMYSVYNIVIHALRFLEVHFPSSHTKPPSSNTTGEHDMVPVHYGKHLVGCTK